MSSLMCFVLVTRSMCWSDDDVEVSLLYLGAETLQQVGTRSSRSRACCGFPGRCLDEQAHERSYVLLLGDGIGVSQNELVAEVHSGIGVLALRNKAHLAPLMISRRHLEKQTHEQGHVLRLGHELELTCLLWQPARSRSMWWSDDDVEVSLLYLGIETLQDVARTRVPVVATARARVLVVDCSGRCLDEHAHERSYVFLFGDDIRVSLGLACSLWQPALGVLASRLISSLMCFVLVARSMCWSDDDVELSTLHGATSRVATVVASEDGSGEHCFLVVLELACLLWISRGAVLISGLMSGLMCFCLGTTSLELTCLLWIPRGAVLVSRLMSRLMCFVLVTRSMCWSDDDVELALACLVWQPLSNLHGALNLALGLARAALLSALGKQIELVAGVYSPVWYWGAYWPHLRNKCLD
ncbi:hypothetical protein Emed_005633 [Eimeria media]